MLICVVWSSFCLHPSLTFFTKVPATPLITVGWKKLAANTGHPMVKSLAPCDGPFLNVHYRRRTSVAFFAMLKWDSSKGESRSRRYLHCKLYRTIAKATFKPVDMQNTRKPSSCAYPTVGSMQPRCLHPFKFLNLNMSTPEHQRLLTVLA